VDKVIFKKYSFVYSILTFLIVLIIFVLNLKKLYLFYPLIGLSLIFLDRKQYEIKFIFIFIGSFLVFLLPKFSDLNRGDVVYLISIIELLSFWFFAYTIYEFDEKKRKSQEMIEAEISKNLLELKNTENDIKNYKNHIEKIEKQLEIKKDISFTIREIQKKNTIEEIKKEIISFIKRYFPDLDVIIISEIGQDNFSSFIYKSKVPVLIKNSKLESRFPKDFFKKNESSIIAVPIIVFGNIVAIIKLISLQPYRLSEDDLRILEILATIAGISIENIDLFRRVNELAIKDPLTGLYTHRYFQEKLDEEILTSARTRIPFSLIIADIDHFKKINDTYGHQIGDIVLKKSAEFFKNNIREIDCLARYGGEEFAFILPGITKKQAFDFAENLRINLNKIVFTSFNGNISASFGISEFPLEASSKSQLIRFADERLYKAKKSGRNICIYE